MITTTANSCCIAFKKTFRMCACHTNKQNKKNEHTWQKNVNTLTVTDQPSKSVCNVWTTNYDSASTITAAEALSNQIMEKQDRTSFQHWLTQPPSGTVHAFFPQPEVSTITHEELFYDKAAQDAWYFSGIFTQDNPQKHKEVTEL